jgi:hypothetical protein
MVAITDRVSPFCSTSSAARGASPFDTAGSRVVRTSTLSRAASSGRIRVTTPAISAGANRRTLGSRSIRSPVSSVAPIGRRVSPIRATPSEIAVAPAGAVEPQLDPAGPVVVEDRVGQHRLARAGDPRAAQPDVGRLGQHRQQPVDPVDAERAVEPGADHHVDRQVDVGGGELGPGHPARHDRLHRLIDHHLAAVGS